MSYRELRKFCEIMKSLGYSGGVSLESFRRPNFELVAHILYWLVQRHDPTADIPEDIATEMYRVNFVKAIAEFMQTKMHIKLNLKRLYQSDVHCVQELMKIALVLQKAMEMGEENSVPDEEDGDSLMSQLQVMDSKATRQLAADLTVDGAAMYDLLQSELNNRESRMRVVSHPQDVNDMEKALRILCADQESEISRFNENLTSLVADEANLEAKIENKRTHLDRQSKRFGTLSSVRPAFMEEYDRLEVELQQQYVVYMEQYRNVEYLESEVQRYHAMEELAMKEHENALRLLREKLRTEELKILRGERPDDAVGDEAGNAKPEAAGTTQPTPGARPAPQQPPAARAQRQPQQRPPAKQANPNQTQPPAQKPGSAAQKPGSAKGGGRPRAASGRQRPKKQSMVEGSMYGGTQEDESESEAGESEEEGDLSINGESDQSEEEDEDEDEEDEDEEDDDEDDDDED
eukprot:NODE_1469_length_1494_cov_19.824433_g1391_i0.p1 GENE.NODE_1469_length_1494_cov_19.824433_g1391_i0~~NODE_1469_length_1494_cov_19.824433_g1391_i0.p1  ORF type:complete len:480 (+),score=136.22 NODE_1469_length_1494_cov_19.824433_g1391_i0:57-1442(+)